MALTIMLQDERGKSEAEPIYDTAGLLHQLLPIREDDEYHYLPYIDRYGDTIFNSLQMEPLLREWQLLRRGSASQEQQLLWGAVERLALRCRETDHLYLRFIGD